MVNKQMIAALVCPACRGALQFDEAAARLNCRPCGLSYPLVNGIPVMLVEKAEPLVVKE